MGKTIIPRYRVEYQTQVGWRKAAWQGRASQKALEAWRAALNRSFLPGGCNERVSQLMGYILRVACVKLVHQKTNAVTCTICTPTFETVTLSSA